MKLTITQIGVPKQVQTQFGLKEKNYIKAQEYNDKFLNYFVSATTKNWKVGDEIEVEAVTERQYQSQDGTTKTSYDIKLPKFQGGVNPEVMKSLEEINNNVTKLSITVQRILSGLADVHKATVGKRVEVDTSGEPNSDDIPF